MSIAELSLEPTGHPRVFLFVDHTPPSPEESLEEGCDEGINLVTHHFLVFMAEEVLGMDGLFSDFPISEPNIIASREIGCGWLSEYLIQISEEDLGMMSSDLKARMHSYFVRKSCDNPE